MTIPCPSLRPSIEPASKGRVAVVSDDSELSEACALVLREEGYAVQTVPHSGHALLACMEGRRIDVLIAELSMDEGSGPALASRMRRYNPNLKAIFIVRPFTREDLLKELQQATGGTGSEPIDPSAYF